MNEDSKVYLTIEDAESLRKFVKGAVKNGYLRRMDLRDVIDWMQTVQYPIRVPVNLDSVIMTGQNPVVKGIFGKSIDSILTNCVRKAMKVE